MNDHADAVVSTARVSVLVVHGIGMQKAGTTLVSVLNGLLALGRRPEVASRVTLTLTRAVVRGEGAPRGTLVLHGRTPGDRADGPIVEALVSEVHWADSFHPPAARSVVSWLALVAPLALVTRGLETIVVAARRWQRHPLHWWRIAAAGAATALLLPIATAAVLAVGVTALVRPLIPVDAVKTALARVEVVLSQVLGDSYLYVMSPTDEAAVDTVVVDAVREAAADGHPVVILAHSQGAEVAVRAIPKAGVPVRHLITVGAGIGQLRWLRHRLESGSSTFLIGAAAWVAVLATSGLLVWLVGQLAAGRQEQLGTVLGLTAGWYLLPYGCVGVVAWLARQGRFDNPQQGRLELVDRWTDYSATADPVSGAPVASRMYEGVEEVVVVNESNLLLDHTSYWQNEDEILRPIAAAVWSSATADDGGPSVLAAPALHLRRAAMRWRVGLRLVAAAAAASLCVRLLENWRASGEGVIRDVVAATNHTLLGRVLRPPETLLGITFSLLVPGFLVLTLFVALWIGVGRFTDQWVRTARTSSTTVDDVAVHERQLRCWGSALATWLLCLALLLGRGAGWDGLSEVLSACAILLTGCVLASATAWLALARTPLRPLCVADLGLWNTVWTGAIGAWCIRRLEQGTSLESVSYRTLVVGLVLGGVLAAAASALSRTVVRRGPRVRTPDYSVQEDAGGFGRATGIGALSLLLVGLALVVRTVPEPLANLAGIAFLILPLLILGLAVELGNVAVRRALYTAPWIVSLLGLMAACGPLAGD